MDWINLFKCPHIIVATILFFAVSSSACSAADWDEFVSWVAPAKNIYKKTHRIYLIDPDENPLFWSIDITYGRNAGGKEIQLYPVSIEPGHPLADFAGLLAPPRRRLGIYIGWDGPPGYNDYALPAYIPPVDFAAMGYWRAGGPQLLQKLKAFIGDKNDMHATDWKAMVNFMRTRLAKAISAQ